MVISKDWFTSWTLWVNLLSIIAVALAVSLQLAGQLELTTQEVALGTVALAVVNGVIRVLRTNQPISGTPAAVALARQAADRLGPNPYPIPPQPGQR